MIQLIGEASIDFMQYEETSILNIGGIFHAARGFKANNIDFSLNFIAPSYLVDHISKNAEEMGCKSLRQIGLVRERPNVMIIQHPEEAKDQGYEFLLNDSTKIDILLDCGKDILPSDECLIFVTCKELADIAVLLGKVCNVSIDISKLSLIDFLIESDTKFNTIFVSTSSEITKKFPKEEDLINYLKPISSTLVYKQNRGGTCIIFKGNAYRIPAYLTDESIHSVGVGDVYDACFISYIANDSVENAGRMASIISRAYSETYNFSIFESKVREFFENRQMYLNLDGVLVPWDLRQSIQIYIAAADFSYSDKKYINEICECLKYHNFKVFRPILENGEIKQSDSLSEKENIFLKDVDAIAASKILLAVYDDYNDPGTLIELGFAWGQGKPTIIFDPLKKAKNPMLLFSSKCISSSLSKIITSVFECSSKFYEN
jgi:Nucleoside 2-deoxyribosyltransferase